MRRSIGSRVNFLAVVAAVLISQASYAYATVVGNNTGVSSGSATGFDGDIVNNDLINTTNGPYTTKLVAGPPTTSVPFGGNTVTGANDGSATASYFSVIENPGFTSVTMTYTFDTAIAPDGYLITSIVSILGFSSDANFYAHQLFDISYTTIFSGTPVLLTSVNYDPFTDNVPGSSKVTLTDTTGVLATNVASLIFTLPVSNNGFGDNTAVYREFDVFGVAVPEPTGFSLASIAVFAIGGIRRKRRS